MFRALWLRNNGISPWHIDEDRRGYVQGVLARHPYIKSRRKNEKEIPAFAPLCAEDHLSAEESIPADWPHVLSMIYQVRCNLFHAARITAETVIGSSLSGLYDPLGRLRAELPPGVVATTLPWGTRAPSKRFLVYGGR